MRKSFAKTVGLVTMVLMALPELAAAAAGKVAKVVIVSDSRFETGWQAWWSNLYNDSHVYFTILTYSAVLVVGLSLALLADVIMSHIGIDLKHRELAEH